MRLRLATATLVAACSLAACGGGSSGVSSPTPVTPATVAPTAPPSTTPSAPVSPVPTSAPATATPTAAPATPAPATPAPATPTPATPTPTTAPATAAPTTAPATIGNGSGTPVYLNDDSNTIVGDPASFSPGGASSSAPVDGIACGNLPTSTHYHVHLSIYSNGRQVAVPNGIGIYHPKVVFPAYFVDTNSSDPASCVYDTHTHAAMGVVHVESPNANATFTLGQFLDIWGVQLSANGFWNYSGATRVFDTDETTGSAGSHPVTERTGQSPSQITLVDHHDYAIEVGAPYVPTPNYTWASSLP